ncbi:MAG TPA: hypothetical protein VHY48_02370 [Acidobacteriaceae bacterium]|jgi:hypothetical protein|nr:hypothetical protein [Acidobacteriaceae bacterium]
MTNGLKAALGFTAVLVIAVGGELLYLHHRNYADQHMVVQRPGQNEEPTLSADDAVFLRKERPDSLANERKLIGTTIWVSAGGQLDYYKDTGKHVDYNHPVGVLAGAEPLVIKDVFEQVPPKTGRAVARIAAGQRHVLLAFTMPKSDDPKQLYATPVGNYDEGSYNFLTDEIFFYDDPHVLYKHWGPAVWAHIDKHEAVLGMSENQAMMALGQVITPHGDNVGDRSVTYYNDNHPVTIDFEHDKAVKITPGD